MPGNKFWTPERKHSLYMGLLLLILAFIVQISAGRYSARSAASAPFVGDLFLDNLPVISLDILIVEASLAFWAIILSLLVMRPRYLLFGLKVIALFIIFRAFFISLTHIGIYPERAVIGDGWGPAEGLYGLFTFQGNFFFSGHTGLPVLMFLIFTKDVFWRKFFFAAAFVFGASVLLAHVHYSIDVFAAPFITYGIFRIAARLFPRDYELLTSSA
ncbi:MAG: phosphatase PAP2-related protein [Patescibacteria group bacterium]